MAAYLLGVAPIKSSEEECYNKKYTYHRWGFDCNSNDCKLRVGVFLELAIEREL